MASAELVLASRSPQRRAILDQLGIRFRAVAPAVAELQEGPPDELVRENALRKSAAVQGGVVLGVDTEVVLDGRALGKPAGRAEAEVLLRLLSGRDHEVLGGVALRRSREVRCEVAVTRVRFRRLSERQLRWYLDCGEWRERAGGYAIQGRGAALVAGIEGDYLNVVGLPVATLLALEPDLVG